MSKITTHILDTAKGRPAEGVRVTLYRVQGPASPTDGPSPEIEIAGGRTNKDGRIAGWPEAGEGVNKIRFETGAYFEEQGIASLYPFVDIYFEVTGDGHYHIPLLISPFGYSTYRGS